MQTNATSVRVFRTTPETLLGSVLPTRAANATTAPDVLASAAPVATTAAPTPKTSLPVDTQAEPTAIASPQGEPLHGDQPYSVEYFMQQDDPAKAARKYAASLSSSYILASVRGDKETALALQPQWEAAYATVKAVEQEVARVKREAIEARKAENAALGGEHSLTWFMAQSDPVKSAQAWVDGLQRTRDKGMTFRGQREQITYANAMLGIVKTVAAGETPSKNAIANLDAARSRMENTFDEAAKYQSNSPSMAKAKKIQEAYDADLKAWQENAIAAGGRAVKGGNGVMRPDGMSREQFYALTGPAPVFSDYEKGGPKYPIT